MASNAQIQNHVTRQRQAVTALLAQIDALRANLEEWQALGLDAAAVDGAMSGENADVAGAQVAAVYTTLGALETLLDQGHATNLYAVKL